MKLRRVFFGSLILATSAAIGLGVYWFFVSSGDGGETAEAALTRLSKHSDETTYYARFEGTDVNVNDPNSFASLTLYNKPGAGIRVDFPAPVHDKEDLEQENDVLKGGDILIVNPACPRAPFLAELCVSRAAGSMGSNGSRFSPLLLCSALTCPGLSNHTK